MCIRAIFSPCQARSCIVVVLHRRSPSPEPTASPHVALPHHRSPESGPSQSRAPVATSPTPPPQRSCASLPHHLYSLPLKLARRLGSPSPCHLLQSATTWTPPRPVVQCRRVAGSAAVAGGRPPSRRWPPPRCRAVGCHTTPAQVAMDHTQNCVSRAARDFGPCGFKSFSNFHI
jgi:hypothetical protein